MLCKAPRGLGFGFGFVSSVGKRSSTLSDALSYDAPIIYANVLGNGPTSGGSVVTVKGQSFGWLDMSSQLRYGGTACAATRWFSTTALFCIVPEGSSIMKSVTVTVQLLRSTLSRVFSYDKMVLEMAYIHSSNMELHMSQNASTVIIIGDNFGTDPRIVSSMVVTVGGSACEISRWISTTTVYCKQIQGVGSTHQIGLTSNFRITSLSDALSYDNPSLSWQSHNANSYRNNSLFVGIFGSGMGTSDYTQKLAISGTVCSATSWISTTSVRARASLGSGGSHSISMTAAIRSGTLSEAHTFDSPSIVRVKLANNPTIGLASIIIDGSGFGGMDWTPSVRLSSHQKYIVKNATNFGLFGTASMVTIWTSDTAINAKSARGHFTSASVIVTVIESVSSLSDALSFDKPNKIQPFPPNSPTRGRLALIAAQGTNFGWMDICAKVRIGGTACEKTAWISDSEIGCGVAAGAQVRNASGLVLTILGVKSGTCFNCFSYNIPYALSAKESNQPTTGNSKISLTGVNFGSIMDYTGAIRFGMSSSQTSIWTSDSLVLCTVSSGVSGLLPIIVTWDRSVSTQSIAFTYGRPQVLFISRLFSSVSGGDKVSISGKFFGTADYSPVAYVDYEQCVSTVWSSDSSLSCGVPRGYGPGRGVAVGVAQEVGKASVIFEYQGQHVLDASGLPMPNHEFIMVWLAADVLKVTTGSQIHQWKDSSTMSANAVARNSPTFLERRINDLPSVRDHL